MTLKIGFSPCPNDTFIFDALVNGKINTGELRFDVVLEDVQTLNEWAQEGRLDITKISYGALPALLNNYIVLSSGGALGRGVGPLLIASEPLNNLNIDKAIIALPGLNTTAHHLFSLAYPTSRDKRFMRFDEIEEFVIRHAGDSVPHLGVIIHENRFTYQEKGLVKILDLGEYWEKETGLPIPLGGIVIKRAFDKEIGIRVNELIAESARYAFANQEVLPDYVKQHAQEMDESVMRKHIELYVNDFSIDLGEAGKAAVTRLLNIQQQDRPTRIFL